MAWAYRASGAGQSRAVGVIEFVQESTKLESEETGIICISNSPIDGQMVARPWPGIKLSKLSSSFSDI